jgi:hypothetical protein
VRVPAPNTGANSDVFSTDVLLPVVFTVIGAGGFLGMAAASVRGARQVRFNPARERLS